MKHCIKSSILNSVLVTQFLAVATDAEVQRVLRSSDFTTDVMLALQKKMDRVRGQDNVDGVTSVRTLEKLNQASGHESGIRHSLRRLDSTTKSSKSSKSPKSSKSSKSTTTSEDEVCTPDNFLTTFNDCDAIAAISVNPDLVETDCNALGVALSDNEALLRLFACKAELVAGVLIIDGGGTSIAEDAVSSSFFFGTGAQVKQQCMDAGALCCQGANSCVWPGEVAIADTACAGDNACRTIGNDTFVAPGACSGNYSCNYLNEGTTFGSVILRNSCDGYSACYGVGKNSIGAVSIGVESCVGPSVCDSVGYKSPSSMNSYVIIEPNACRGSAACYAVHSYVEGGTKTEGSTYIASGACIGDNSCNSFGYNNTFTLDLQIRNATCVGDAACANCVRFDGDFCPPDSTSLVINETTAMGCPTPVEACRT